MASEIRVNKIANRAGLSTVEYTDTGIIVSGIVTCTEISGLNALNIAGVSTFASPLDINGDIDVDGHTNLDNLSVAGVSTFTGAVNTTNVVVGDFLNVGSNIKLGNAGVVTATSYRGDGSQLTGIVAGLSTISGVVNVANDLDVDGHTELDNVRISGITTVSGEIRKPLGSYHPMLTIRNQSGGSVAMRIDNWSNSVSTKRMSITHNFNRISSAFAADDSSIGCASVAFEDGEIRFGTSAAGTNNSSTRFYINSSGHFIPNADSTYDIGTNSVRVRNFYADTLYGDGANLSNLPASAPVGGASTNTVFFENAKEVAVNYQITTNKNAMSAGPIAINAGIAVTVPSGSSWTIV